MKYQNQLVEVLILSLQRMTIRRNAYLFLFLFSSFAILRIDSLMMIAPRVHIVRRCMSVMCFNNMNGLPKNNNVKLKHEIKNIITSAASILLISGGKKPAFGADINSIIANDDGSVGKVYVDQNKGFYFYQPNDWTILKKTLPTPSATEYRLEENLVVANNLKIGASLGVTKTYARRLLQDFKIDWWFAPLVTIMDLGSPELVAQLLILQRQGDFEKKQTPSEITMAQFVGDDLLLFEFLTPLRDDVYRKTSAKAIYRDGLLFVMWVSTLSSVFEESKTTLQKILDSFTLTNAS